MWECGVVGLNSGGLYGVELTKKIVQIKTKRWMASLCQMQLRKESLKNRNQKLLHQ